MEKVHSWICNRPWFVNSHLAKDQFYIKENTTSEVIKMKKLLIKIPIREVQNYLIKPPSESICSVARL